MTEATAGPGPQTPRRPADAALALLVAGTFFMENLDATIMTPAIPHMAESFQVAPIALNIGVSAYVLTLGILIPVSGWVADRFGARAVFTSAIALFTLASLLCAAAPSLETFVAARVLQGAGGALMVPVGRLVVLRATPKHELIRAIALLTWPALVAPVLGPPLGGLMADHGHWRLIFAINLPLGLVALALAWRLVPDSRAGALGPFDWIGFVLTGAALVALLMAAELLGQAGASLAKAGALAVAGTGLLIAGALHFRRAPAPMIDLATLKVKTFAITIWGGSLFRLGVSAVPFLVPLMFQIGFGADAFFSGMVLMAVFAGNLAMKPLTTTILRRFGFRRVLIVNGLLNATAIGACAAFTPQTPLAIAAGILFLGGMTRSMQFTALNTIAFADMPDDRMSAANTLFSAMFQLAMGLGIAFAALAWRAGDTTAALFGGTPDAPFRIAFLLVAAVSLLSLLDVLALPRDAGDRIAGRRVRG